MKSHLNIKAKVLAVILVVAFVFAQMVPVFALNVETDPMIVVSDAIGALGGTASVTIDLKNNPGIVSMTLRMSYDDEVLTLTEVNDAGILGSTSHKPELVSPYTLVWVNDTATTNYTVNGTIVTLVFAVSDTAEKGTIVPIEITYDYYNYDVYDKDANKIKFEIDNGSVTVGEPGPNSIEDFTYTTSGTEITITSYKGTATDVVIGDRYTVGGVEYTVTEIAMEAFLGQEEITSVTIPETVETIGEAAFYDCISLTEVTVLNPDAEIGEVAFGYYYASRKEHVVEGFTISGYAGSTAEAYAETDDEITFKAIAVECSHTGGEATCKNAAVCEKCGESYGSLNADNHKNIKIHNASEATCSAPGYTGDHICSDCGEITSYGNEIPTSSHSYVETVVHPTKEEQGYTIHTCSACGDSYIDSYTDYIPTDYTEGDYEYTVSNGEATITKYNGDGGDVTIPSTLGGYPVTAIADGAFDGCSSLTVVSMPSVTTIGSYAFANCATLKRVYIPSATSISENAFHGSSSAMIYAPLNSYAQEYAEENSIYFFEADDFGYEGDYTYYVANGEATIADYNGDGGAVTVPSTIGGYPVKAIGPSAFKECTSLTSVNMPSVVTVSYSAFKDCTSLTSVNMPVAEAIDYRVFDSCSNLTNVEMPRVTSIGSSAFRYCSCLTNVSMPSVISIDYSAFRDCTALKSVDMPVATTIAHQVFQGCYSLTSVSIPNVTSIGDYVFKSCNSELTIYAPDNDYAKQYAADNGIKYDGPEENVIKSVSYEVSGDKVIFTVTTTPDFNRVKVSLADSLSSYIVYTNNYNVNADGDYVFTLSVPAIVGTTEYAFDGRKVDTNKYSKNYAYQTVECAETEVFKSVSYEIKDDKIIFTVVTAAGDYNRIKVANANAVGTSLGVGTYTVDANGNYVWTVKANAPKETTTFAFDLRTTANKYLKDYYEFNVEVTEKVEIFKSTSYEIVDGKVIFTVVTPAGDYNRVKISLLDKITSYVKYVDTYTVNADGDYVWTLKFNAPTTVTEYALDIRVASTKKYVKDYYYVTINPIVEEPEADTVYISANGEIKDGKLKFTIVTKPTDINRIKVMLTSDQTSYVKLISKYTVDENGNYVWTASIAAPSETTSYTLDVRSSITQKYLKDFYSFDVSVVEEVKLYKSVSHEIVNGKTVFTVVTAAGDYDRMKVTTSANLGGSLGVGSYTVNANGDYVWTIKATAPTEDTEYAFDLRIAGGKYLKDYYKYNVTL